jgi:hypothetical protein
MKILLTLGMVIIFISVFFIFFTFSTSIKGYADCLSNNWPYPSACKNSSWPFIAGLVMIGFFVMIDIGVIYVIFSSLKPQSTLL